MVDLHFPQSLFFLTPAGIKYGWLAIKSIFQKTLPIITVLEVIPLLLSRSKLFNLQHEILGQVHLVLNRSVSRIFNLARVGKNICCCNTGWLIRL